MINTGDILLVSSNTKRGRKIQKFQQRYDKESGKWSHSGLFYRSCSGVLYVVEADVISGYKLKAAVIFTPWIEYKKKKNVELKVLKANYEVFPFKIEDLVLRYAGTPYDYLNLTIYKPIQYLFGKWLGGKANYTKRFICHEFVQTVLHETHGIFTRPQEGNISDIYHSKHYKLC